MLPLQYTLLASAIAGFVALFLISGDLAKRSRLSGTGRVILSSAIGTGVIVVSIKLFLVGFLLDVTRNYHSEPRPVDPAALADRPDFHLESPLTAAWRALPDRAPTPDEQPLRPEVVRLGQRLFHDPGLSVDGQVACGSCHKLQAGGDDDETVSTGIGGHRGSRNAPTVWNAAFLSRLFWDGRAHSLEDQAKGPLVNPREMGMPSHDAVEARIAALPGYEAAFARAFGSRPAITIDNIVRAIASFERTLITPETRYDRFVAGDPGSLTDREIRGMALFAGLGCRACHRDPTFSAAGKIRAAGILKPFPIHSDSSYVRKYDLVADRGLMNGTAPGTLGLWRVPSLRNVANTAPYFHNGAVATLEEAIRIMAATQLNRLVVPDAEPDVPAILWDSERRKLTPYRPKDLTQDDVTAIAAFLKTLSNPKDTPEEVSDPPEAMTGRVDQTDLRVSPRPGGVSSGRGARTTGPDGRGSSLRTGY